MEVIEINHKVQVKTSDSYRGGVKSHFGWVEDIVKNMFDGSDIYIVRMRVNNKPVVRTYTRESLIPVKGRQKNIKHLNL